MIGRLISFVGGALLYFSLATLIAEAVMAGYVWSKWNLDRDKIAQLVAVARGLEPVAPPPAAPAPPRDEAAAEQVAFNQVMELRAMKDKNIELREQALADAVGKLRVDQQKLADDDKRYRLDRADYESKLAAAAKGAKTTGQEEVRRILLAIKPKQAKEFLQRVQDPRGHQEDRGSAPPDPQGRPRSPPGSPGHGQTTGRRAARAMIERVGKRKRQTKIVRRVETAERQVPQLDAARVGSPPARQEGLWFRPAAETPVDCSADPKLRPQGRERTWGVPKCRD